jgi:hypothetical protein
MLLAVQIAYSLDGYTLGAVTCTGTCSLDQHHAQAGADSQIQAILDAQELQLSQNGQALAAFQQSDFPLANNTDTSMNVSKD